MNASARNIFISLSANLVLFSAAWFFLCPVYHSRDDVFILYQLGGGFGDAPTNLLHYNHMIHPLLGGAMSNLFLLWPHINWFGVFLFIVILINGSVIFYLLLQQQKQITAVILYLLYFLIVICWFVLHLNLSVASSACAITSFVLMLYYSLKQKSPAWYVLPLLLLVAGSLFRIHTILPVAVVMAPLFLLVNGIKHKLTAAATVVCAVVLIFALNRQHVEYYKKHIAGWEQEEAYRNSVFTLVNQRPDYKNKNLKNYSSKVQVLSYGLFFDKDYFDTDTIRLVSTQLHSLQPKTFAGLTRSLYWLCMENKIFIFLLLVTALSLFISMEKKKAYFLFLYPLAILFLLTYMILFLKVPFYLVPVILAATTAGFYVVLFPLHQHRALTNNFFLPVAFLMLLYAVIRIYKINTLNVSNAALFKRSVHQISSRPQNFFVLMDYGFPLEYAPLNIAPSSFAISNGVFNGHFLHNETEKMFQRNGLHHLQDLWTNEKVLFWSMPVEGKSSPFNYFLLLYLTDKYKMDASFSDPLPGYSYGEVRKLIIRKNQ